jgi:hypothetical protein
MIASPIPSHRLLMSYSAPLGALSPLGQFGQSGPFGRQAQRPAVDAAIPKPVSSPARSSASGLAGRAAVERLPSPAAAGLGATAAVAAVACLAAIGGLGVAMAAWAWSLISHWLWAAAMARL